MQRFLAWYAMSSSIGAVVALVVANAIPLVGVLSFGWSVWTILIVYWLENGIVGAFNVLKMRRAQGTDDGGTGNWTLNGTPASNMAKGGLISFFVMHYGLFWVVHGVFVFTLPLFAGMARTARTSGRLPTCGRSCSPWRPCSSATACRTCSTSSAAASTSARRRPGRCSRRTGGWSCST
jgi:hypothetical protein